MSPGEDGFVLVVRVWLHDGVPVARLMALPPSGPSPYEATAVAGLAEIIAVIERWVTDLVSGAAGPT
jgi:hypothetical protein